MAYVEVSPEVRYRDDSGRFLAACNQAAIEAIVETVDEGVDIAQRLAPAGRFEDDRGPTLREGIVPVLAGKVGFVASTARHSMIVERGSREHDIGAPGQVLYSGERKFGPVRGPVRHPGTQAQPYMRPMYAILKRKMLSIMARFYPG